jgi:predicted secreted protein
MSDQGSMPPPPPPSGGEGGGYGAPPPSGGYGAPPPPGPGYGGYGGGGYGGGYGAPQGAPPPNNLVWAILTTLFCCLPLGIVSIVFAAQVNSKWAAGDVAGAHEASQKARRWAMWSAIAGLVVVVLYVILVVGAGVSSDSTA